jgi:hypothetical protein
VIIAGLIGLVSCGARLDARFTPGSISPSPRWCSRPAAGSVALAQVVNRTPTGFCGGGLLGDVECGPGALIRFRARRRRAGTPKVRRLPNRPASTVTA